ncbi:Replication protein A 70 kDa DNA-binding subunit B, partial [Linum perenne]
EEDSLSGEGKSCDFYSLWPCPVAVPLSWWVKSPFLSISCPELHLRLLHAWKLADPSKPGSLFAFGTHWVDAKGTTVQGDSHKNFTSLLQSRISVGSVYKITGFGLRPPRKNFRTSLFRHCLDLTPTTQFLLQQPTTPPFCVDSLQYFEFEDFNGRVHPPFPYLTDFVGKIVSAGEPNYVQRPGSVACVQNLTITNERGVEVVVSLWGDLAQVVDANALTIAGASNSGVIAFAAFRVTQFSGKVGATSCSASRVCLHPSDSRSDQLRSFFSTTPRPVTYVPPKFSTPEKLQTHVRESYRTIHGLLALYESGADSETRYRCSAVIKGFETHSPWFYHACPNCYKSVAPNHANFWCPVHEAIQASDVQYRYRLKLIVSDNTAEATFVLLGMTAERIMPIPAAVLVRAYPNDYGRFPPAIDFLVDQNVEFEVQLPRFSHANPFGDFTICTISGLHIPRADLVNELPAPVLNPPSPPRPHNTPMPGDPAYVAPILTYVPPPAAPPPIVVDHSVNAPSRSPPNIGSMQPETATLKARGKAKAVTTEPPRKSPRGSKNSSTKVLPASPSDSDDDQPLSKIFLKTHSPHISTMQDLSVPSTFTTSPPSQTTRSPVTKIVTPPPKNVTPTPSIRQQAAAIHAFIDQSRSTLSQMSVPVLQHASNVNHAPSNSSLTLPLAKVKIEKLMSPPSAIPITPPLSIGDELQPELGRGKRKQTKKKLFNA